MSRDLPNYDAHALSSGDDHECCWVRVMCLVCGEISIVGAATRRDEHASCGSCDREFALGEMAGAECACNEPRDDEDDEREERES